MGRTIAVLALLLTMCFSAGLAQETVTLDPGESVVIEAKDSVRVVTEVDSIPYPDTVTVVDTVEVCPSGWTCTPPHTEEPEAEYSVKLNLPDTSYVDDEIPDTVTAGQRAYFEVYRTDGCGWNWTGDPDRENPECPWLPFPDSIVLHLDGDRQRERLYPYTYPGTDETFAVPVGDVVLTWQAYGEGAAAGELSFVGADEDGDNGGDPAPPPPEPSSRVEAIMGVPMYESWSQPVYDSTYLYAEAIHDRRDSTWTGYYYDRGFGYYGAWWRTGDSTYLEKGHRWVEMYREDYLVRNNYGSAPRWTFPEGLAVHYLTTGDEASLEALTEMCTGRGSWITREGNESILDTRYRDGRIQGRAWLCQSITYAVTGEQQYADLADLALTDMLTWYDAAGGDGRWDSCALPGVSCGQPSGSYCGGMAPFMTAHAILDAFVRHHELVAPVDRLTEVLDETLDHLWEHWTPGRGLAYIIPPAGVSSFSCEDGGTGPAKDIILLSATAWAHGAHYTGHERHAERFREMWETGLSPELNLFFEGSKQFNQSFMRSWRGPYRVGWSE